jgi:translation initiation factor 4E
MVRLKKGLASRYWEELVLAIIGEQFDVGHEICGAVVSIRHNEDIISVWNKNADNTEAKNKIRLVFLENRPYFSPSLSISLCRLFLISDQLRRILKLPQFIAIEYKKHQDSIVDKSSFR